MHAGVRVAGAYLCSCVLFLQCRLLRHHHLQLCQQVAVHLVQTDKDATNSTSHKWVSWIA
jgi:hypothetical protein